jgi:hypothetical protein
VHHRTVEFTVTFTVDVPEDGGPLDTLCLDVATAAVSVMRVDGAVLEGAEVQYYETVAVREAAAVFEDAAVSARALDHPLKGWFAPQTGRESAAPTPEAAPAAGLAPARREFLLATAVGVNEDDLDGACDECGAAIPPPAEGEEDAGLVNKHHEKTCSLHPDNIA